jgi:chromosome segregation ATPase
MLVATFVISCLCNVALASSVTPLEEVTTMLTELRTKVNEEGDKEAETYNTFACFCKTNIEEKNKAIADGKTEKDSLESKINDDATIRDEEDVKIGEKSKEITDLEEEIVKAKRERKAEHLTYGKNEVELTAGIQALNSAIQALKASKQGVGFAQLPAVAQNALVMAQALIPEKGTKSKALTAFISEDAPNDEYSFHGDDVIATLEGLRDDFKGKKNRN